MTRVVLCGSPIVGLIARVGVHPRTDRVQRPPGPNRSQHASGRTNHSAAATTSSGRTRRDLRFQRPTQFPHFQCYDRIAVPLVRHGRVRAAI